MSRSIVSADGLHQSSHSTPPAADLIAPINAAHLACVAAAGSAVQYAIEAGRLLSAAKAQVGHGGWMAWVEANCRFTYHMAVKYMRVAANLERVPNLDSAQSLRQALAMLAEPVVAPEVLARLEEHDPDLAWKVDLGQIKPKRAQLQMLREQRQAEDAELIAARAANPDPERVRLIHGRFQDADVADESLDWIITDVPYGEDYLDLCRELSTLGSRKLKLNGQALVMGGCVAQDQTKAALSESLTHHHTLACALELGNHFAILPEIGALNAWKPVFWLFKGRPPSDRYLPDAYICKHNEYCKDDHTWQQSQAFFDWLVRTYTQVGQLVCDPMMGTGTTGISCVTQHRDFIGIETDQDTFEGARLRILACEAKGRDRAPDLAAALE